MCWILESRGLICPGGPRKLLSSHALKVYRRTVNFERIRLKVNLHSIRFSYVFVRFFTFLLLLEKVYAFSSAFLCVHIRTNQTVTYWTKVVRKNFFCKGVRRYFEISLLSFVHKIFEQNFYLYITVYLVRIWTYKNADEKAHTFSRRSKNVKKRTKTYEKRILCKPTLIFCQQLYIKNN